MVWIFPCAGARDAPAQTALDDAFAKRGYPAIKSLRRDSHVADDSCWLHGEGYCLSNAE
jgi:protein-L-isoaspartate(D-aspartate) O-methyltransferase